MAVKRILFVWPVCRYSVWDVAVGWNAALKRILGDENVVDYFFDRRVMYHQGALPLEKKGDVALLSKLSTETILTEALYGGVDAVLIVSALTVHAAGPWLLRKAGIPCTVLFTESPYEDPDQVNWLSTAPGVNALTNERWSAKKFGWEYLPHSYDPLVHKPSDPSLRCDVLFVGTGWGERQRLLESVDWKGIDLRLYGTWSDLPEASPLRKFLVDKPVNNRDLPAMYSGAKICLSMNRSSLVAESLGPRAYEIAACGAFQLSDERKELHEIFDGTVPIFRPETLETRIRHYLRNDELREWHAREAAKRVRPFTFDHRAPILLAALEQAATQQSVGV